MSELPLKPIHSKFNDQQWQAIHQEGNNILVAASAGSGKTTVLIERVINHLERGHLNLDQLLVVTFTEAAAKEMKERLEEKLRQIISDQLPGPEQQFYVDQLNRLANSHIQTIHSFCLAVIQQFFYLIDLNPNFSLLTDATEQAMLYQKVWENLLTEIVRGDHESSLSLEEYSDLLGQYAKARSDDRLYQMVIVIFERSNSHPQPDSWLKNLGRWTKDFQSFMSSDLYEQSLASQYREAIFSASQLLDQAQQSLNACQSETIEKYAPVLDHDQEQLAVIYQALDSSDLERLIDAITNINFPRWPNNSKKSEDYEWVQDLKELRDQASQLVKSDIQSTITYPYQEMIWVEEQAGGSLDKISNLVLLFKNKLQAHKRSQHILEYADLEHFTLDILAPIDPITSQRQAGPAAVYYQDLFKEVMVDEYQDVNEIQSEILSWLSHEKRTDLPGNLFMVGDVKQSIYGFRMAEPSLFLAKYQNYQVSDQGELIVLDQNYRSRDEVLQFTNYLFERLMDQKFGEMDYHLPEALKTGNKSFQPVSPDPAFKIDLLINCKSSTDDLVDPKDKDWQTSEEKEAHMVAQSIQELLANDYQIYDKEQGMMRSISYKDIVILSSTKKVFLTYQQIFARYQIPLKAQNIDNYFQRQEIQLFLSLLKLIDNPMQDIPLVAVLRSYFVGLTDEDLARIRIEVPNGLFYAAILEYARLEVKEKEALVIQEKIAYFLSQLDQWRRYQLDHSLVELIWKIYDETYYLDYVSGLSNGRQRQANLHALYQRAQDYQSTHSKDLFSFIYYIEQVMNRENDLAEPQVLDPDEDQVRVMTVHASKGLEFPVVYLVNTGKKFNLQDVQQGYTLSKQYGMATDYYQADTYLKYSSYVHQAYKIEQADRLKAEEMRKLYVALTRCEQKLFIVGTVDSVEQWEKQADQVGLLSDPHATTVDRQLRRSSPSWLTWINQALSFKENKSQTTSFQLDQLQISFYSDQLVASQVQQQTQQTNNIDHWLEQISEQLHQETPVPDPSQGMISHWQLNYDYPLATSTSSYQSVSELKRLYEEPLIEKIDYEGTISQGIQGIRYTQDSFQAPKFIQAETSNYSYADIGSFTHFYLQQLDFACFRESTDYLDLLIKQANQLVAQAKMTQDQVQFLDLDKIAVFLNSPLGQILIRNAENFKREKAFSYLLDADRILGQHIDSSQVRQLSQDQLLIHGVIDGYLIYEDQLILLDYKTDRQRAFSNFSQEDQVDQIKDKYRFPLSIYKEALSQALGRPVKTVYLVLLDFGLVVEMEDLIEF
ncbi:helicase-exonuclease AddAB subunit AddA [Hutsoniella sourekii]|uniref:helicase-exonuclease AddAB subunit AddA n=1 Tax=Hutsoniella sourekii TaxID=87650 RepID=UPI0004B1E05D|nr:helicase-exonuclease AddAB subunit AddA [Hutsoniella sourekii]